VTEYLDLDDLLIIIGDAVGDHVAVRDHGLLVSAAVRPQAIPRPSAAVQGSLSRR
jgi:hypothetical protein